MYAFRTPFWLTKVYPSCVWRIDTDQADLYLTFDDGPHPMATDFVLKQLALYGAKATFFCVGENAQKYPDLMQRIFIEGHAIGNHTMHHLNGWKTSRRGYLRDIQEARAFVPSNLFRPPYGRIGPRQLREITRGPQAMTVIMWDLLAGDFDPTLKPETSLERMVLLARPGSILVMHDSAKAWMSLSYTLPKLLDHFSSRGYAFKALPYVSSTSSETTPYPQG